MMKLAFGLCLLSMAFLQSTGRPSFVALIPNGNGVTGVRALGHLNGIGGGATNAFGKAFQTAGYKWSSELCQADSDGDGATNGEELGDPCCSWTPSAGFASPSSTTPTHPGAPNRFTASQLTAMKCSEADIASVALSGAASSTTSLVASGSTDFDGNSSSTSGSFDDVVTPKVRPRFPGPKLDRTLPTPTTSDAGHLKTVVFAAYCFSIALALAV